MFSVHLTEFTLYQEGRQCRNCMGGLAYKTTASSDPLGEVLCIRDVSPFCGMLRPEFSSCVEHLFKEEAEKFQKELEEALFEEIS